VLNGAENGSSDGCTTTPVYSGRRNYGSNITSIERWDSTAKLLDRLSFSLFQLQP
jgi:hypothetical protein